MQNIHSNNKKNTIMSVTKHKFSKLYHPFKIWIFLSFLISSHPSFSSDYDFFHDSDLWKQSIANFTKIRFDPTISPESFSLVIQDEPFFYMFSPLIPEKNLGLFIPCEIYNSYYKIMCEINENPQSLFMELKRNWDIDFQLNNDSPEDKNIFSLRLVHKKNTSLIVFLGTSNEVK
jgi:hypothetical protein